MNRALKIAGSILVFLLFIFLIWRFSSIVAYVLIAVVISFIGHPIVRLLDRFHIGKFKIPHIINTAIALLFICAIFFSFFLIFVPLISSQAKIIADIDSVELAQNLKEPIAQTEKFLIEFGAIDVGSTLEETISLKIDEFVKASNFSNIFKDVIGIAGSAFIGVFSVLFLAFFFIKDNQLFYNGVKLLVPEKYEHESEIVISQSRYFLSRYFIGLCLELLIMMTLITIGLSILGVKNALLIGFLGGLMNIIPYIGPIIGALIGVTLGVVGHISLGIYSELLPLTTKILSVFLIANLIDNFFIQPLIYSNSVKAHPIEIFLVILIGGSLSGIVGMILAIPAYTFFRIIAKQFLNQSRLVKAITKGI